MKFKTGDRVKIRRDSQFYGQSYVIGTVVKEKEEEGYWEEWVNVDFDDGYKNAYRYYDLELAKPRINYRLHVNRLLKYSRKYV